MDIRQLQYLVALAEERHFTRAAERCHVTQPTLSGRIRQLEQELGVPIVERGQRYHDLTAEGQRVLQWAQAILRDCNAMTEELTALKGGLAGRLALGVVPSALPMVVALTQAMRRRHADARFAVYSRTSDEILREVQEFQLDAGITYLDNEPVRHMTTLDLYAERYRLFVPHDHALAARTSIGWAEAATETFCLLTPNMQNRRIINQAFEAAGVQPEPPIETDSIINVWAHIKFAGLSSILPEYFNELLAPDTAIRSIPLEHSGPAHRVGLITLERDPLSPLVSALFDTCRDRRFFPLDIEATNR
ncbi:LysR family transcriptional regulator [Salinisphaera orenii]|uniref:LysR family transcriptional regulator n=1 Tax=Salinisphaera orenii YIM 95161 TaxID=1051139 RepID=A0A423PKB4_9GAMM|nr:LysR family transcriptional regulator [Salinisphaera halophila]ROO26035.1 LysR family transcriptional regulator [Salinisphaera halophila YIM 95161]